MSTNSSCDGEVADADEVSERSIDELRRAAKAAMEKFYQEPNYSIYSTPQPPEHEQTEIAWGHRRASADKGIADVILGLWRLNLDTLGSCERRSSGKAYVLLPVPGEAKLFFDLLQRLGIPAELKEKTRSARDSTTGQDYRIPGGNVLFEPIDIPRIVSALSAAEALMRLSRPANNSITESPSDGSASLE